MGRRQRMPAALDLTYLGKHVLFLRALSPFHFLGLFYGFDQKGGPAARHASPLPALSPLNAYLARRVGILAHPQRLADFIPARL